MKVLRQKMNQQRVNRHVPKFCASDFIISLDFKLFFQCFVCFGTNSGGFNSPAKFIGFSLLSILVTIILPLGMANLCDVIFPRDCKVCTLSFRNITFSLLNWNINFNRYTISSGKFAYFNQIFLYFLPPPSLFNEGQIEGGEFFRRVPFQCLKLFTVYFFLPGSIVFTKILVSYPAVFETYGSSFVGC